MIAHSLHSLRLSPMRLYRFISYGLFSFFLFSAFACTQQPDPVDKNMVSFSNETMGPVDIYRVDEEDAEQFSGRLEQGSYEAFETVAAQLWRFKQDEQLIDTYQANGDPRQFHIITVTGVRGLDDDENIVDVDTEEPDAFVERSLRSLDFQPNYEHPEIQYLPNGFVLPNLPVTIWSKDALFDLGKTEAFTLSFDAVLTNARQEIIIAFSNNKRPWGQEGADALTVRMSPQDQDIWIRTGYFENWVSPRLFYNSSEQLIAPDQTYRYAVTLTATDITVAIDGRDVAVASLEEATVPRSGSVGFDVFSNPELGEPTITYQQISIREKPLARPGDDTIAQQENGNRDFDPVNPTNPGAIDLTTTGRYHALIIGVEDYHDAQINDLDFPIRDAENFLNALTTHYTFVLEDVTFLRNPTKARVTNALDSLVLQVKPEDNLLIFYAGHGYWDERMQQGFWLPADAEKGFRANWLSNGTIRDYIKGIQSHHTLLISDACFSGGIFKTRAAFSGADRATQELFKLPSRKAMTSGTLKEVPDKSVFVSYLIQKLEDNNQPFLTTNGLFNALREPVINNSPLEQVPQFGVIQSTGDEGGEFVFKRKD